MTPVQQTIKKSVSCNGIGLHTGVECTVTFKSAPENAGLRFVRTDVEGCPEIRADIDHVIDVSRGTTLEANGVRIHTVEHVLAAAMGLEIDNMLMELGNKEPPAMDGSSRDFVEALQSAGIATQKEPREYVEIYRDITYSDETKNVEIKVTPSDRFQITCIIDYKERWPGYQNLTLQGLQDFAHEVAPARTFCYLSEVEALRDRGLAKGGNLGNTLVVMDREMDEEEVRRLRAMFNIEEDIVPGSNGILQGVELRFENEPVRHKALDLMGDLALLGMPVQGHVIAARSGHASHVEFVRKIRREYGRAPSGHFGHQ